MKNLYAVKSLDVNTEFHNEIVEGYVFAENDFAVYEFIRDNYGFLLFNF